MMGCGDSAQSPTDAGTSCIEDPAVCASSNAACGVIHRQDGPCVACGRCALPLICGGAGVANQCGCTQTSCAAEGVQCGEIDDGCGAPINCGTCQAGEVCVNRVCAPQIPIGGDCSFARQGCEPGSVCCLVGTGTLCVEASSSGSCPGELPDLTVRNASTMGSISIVRRTFAPTACAISDGCLGAPGERRLLRFGTFIENLGRKPAVLGVPQSDPAFQYDACTTHMHYHYADFMTYSLHAVSADGSLGPAIVQTNKASHCLEDGKALAPESPESAGFSCGAPGSTQGLTQGWGYTYEPDVDCQWLDITDVPNGEYLLQIVIDPNNKFPEEREDNNTKYFGVTLE